MYYELKYSICIASQSRVYVLWVKVEYMYCELK